MGETNAKAALAPTGETAARDERAAQAPTGETNARAALAPTGETSAAGHLKAARLATAVRRGPATVRQRSQRVAAPRACLAAVASRSHDR